MAGLAELTPGWAPTGEPFKGEALPRLRASRSCLSSASATPTLARREETERYESSKGNLAAAEPFEVSVSLLEIATEPAAPVSWVRFRVPGRVHEHFYAAGTQDANVLRNRAAVYSVERHDHLRLATLGERIEDAAVHSELLG
jgi:hypothetical protein